MIKTGAFNEEDLVLVKSAPPKGFYTFKIGDKVELNSGSPPLEITEINGDIVTYTYKSGGNVCKSYINIVGLHPYGEELPTLQ
jgi:uncharacterized protein YodC (DUF2158 family)